MADYHVGLQTFIRNFVNSIPKDRDKKQPLIYMEFWDSHTASYSSRILIHRVESLKNLRYNYVTDGPDEAPHEWTVSDVHKVINILPPANLKKGILKRPKNDNLGVIQIRHL